MNLGRAQEGRAPAERNIWSLLIDKHWRAKCKRGQCESDYCIGGLRSFSAQIPLAFNWQRISAFKSASAVVRRSCNG